MWVIAPEDLDKVAFAISQIIEALSDGTKRVDMAVGEISLGDNLPPPIVVTGYWVTTGTEQTDIMRIDIKLKR